MFEENIKNFRTRLTSRGYPNNLVDKILSEVKFAERKNALTQKQKARKKILPFVTQFHPSLPCLKNILMEKMAFNTKPAATKRGIQGTSLDLL